MTWEEKMLIKEKSNKQLQSIDNLIYRKKYDEARREAFKLLKRFPRFWELNNRIVLLNHILGDDQTNIDYLNNALKQANKSSIRSTLFECYYYIHSYQKAFDLLDDFMENAKENKLKDYRLYEVVLMKKLGMDIHLLDFEKNNYVLNQIVNYDETCFYNNIENSIEHYRKKNIIINPNIDYPSLVDSIINSLEKAERSKYLRSLDTYYFRYDNYAIDETKNETLNYIRIKVMPGTKDIIYIDPAPASYPDICNELYIKKEEYHSSYQLKRKNQIDKFYSRYQK